MSELEIAYRERVRRPRRGRHVPVLARPDPDGAGPRRSARRLRQGDRGATTSRSCRSRTASPRTTTRAGGCCWSGWATACWSSATTWSPPTTAPSRLAAGKGLINAVLIKANQIGTLYETLLAMLVTLGKGLELVVSHRSKSPNDDMEAHIALAVNALGLKCGGGANTERLVKYQAVSRADAQGRGRAGDGAPSPAAARRGAQSCSAYEEPTNAGIPTVGVEVELFLPDAGVAAGLPRRDPAGHLGRHRRGGAPGRPRRSSGPSIASWSSGTASCSPRSSRGCSSSPTGASAARVRQAARRGPDRAVRRARVATAARAA